MVRKIVDTKDPILRQKSKPVLKVDKKIKELAQDLEDTLKLQKDPEGVGLAACQIGKSQRMFAMVFKGKIRIIINPEIISVEKRKKSTTKSKKDKKKRQHTILEGCLSIPYYYGPLKRSPKLTLRFLDVGGEETTEVFEGFPAQIVQHEVDHLNGRLFIDEIIKQKRPLYKIDPKTDEWERVELI
jgi:peptide deformylase